NVVLFPDSTYVWGGTPPLIVTTNDSYAQFPLQQQGVYPYPYFGVNTTNHLQFFVIDTSANRIIDYASFKLNTFRDLTREVTPPVSLTANDYGPGGTSANPGGGVWNTNRDGDPLTGQIEGVKNQIGISLGIQTISPTDWITSQTTADYNTQQGEINNFSD